jgi:hypothetical protein
MDTTGHAPAAAEAAETERCPCGKPLHYADARQEQYIRQLILGFGPTVVVRTPQGAWQVPRHYLALHPITAAGLPALARLHHWRNVAC